MSVIKEKDYLSKTTNQIVLEPKKGWKFINFKELREYRDLFFFLVWRDIKILYKQTVLGFLWAIIRPVFSMVIFTIVFGRLAKVPSDGIPYPIFSYVALLPWTYFATSLTKSSDSLVSSASMLTKIYFPRLIIPFTPVLAGLLDFAIASTIMGVMMIWYGIVPNLNIVFLPLLILLMVLTASGIGMWLSALAIQYRDIKYAMQFAMQLLMYAAPVVWPASLIPEKYRLLYGIYPMAGVIEGFRSSLIGVHPMPWDFILMGTISSILIFISGALYFRQMERVFADVA
ncbi:MAG: ABC transporter permease [Candidatus Brocadiaceae bacterium]|nr:ABC transporter permease [Candidatus Brocadiaceae bacterium]